VHQRHGPVKLRLDRFTAGRGEIHLAQILRRCVVVSLGKSQPRRQEGNHQKQWAAENSHKNLPFEKVRPEILYLSLGASPLLALPGGGSETATSAPALPEPFAFLRRHLLPSLGHALFHATPKIGAVRATRTHTKVSEQNPAESEQSESLPESNLPPSEHRRQVPVPQVHHDFTADRDKERYSQHRQRRYPDQSFFSAHLQSLILS
jgi:hypothetical protein